MQQLYDGCRALCVTLDVVCPASLWLGALRRPLARPADTLVMSVPLLEVESLTKTFGATIAVNAISFRVEPGEIFGFLGPNGAGKTTTIRMLTGLLRPTAGRALLGGFDIVARPEAAKRMFGYVPDEPNLYGKLTPVEFLNFIGDVYGMDGRRKRERIGELLDLFELTSSAGEFLEGFSHGMKQ